MWLVKESEGEGSLTGDKIVKNLEIFWKNCKTIIIIADPQGTSSTLEDYLAVLPWSGTFSSPWTCEMLLLLVTFPKANSVDNVAKYLAWRKRSFTSCLSKSSISSTYLKNVNPRSRPESVMTVTVTSPGAWEPECKKGIVLKISNDTETLEYTLMPCTMLNLILIAAPTNKGLECSLRRNCCLCNDICKRLDFLVFSDKEDKL